MHIAQQGYKTIWSNRTLFASLLFEAQRYLLGGFGFECSEFVAKASSSLFISNHTHQNWTYHSNRFQPSICVRVTRRASKKKKSKGKNKQTNLTAVSYSKIWRDPQALMLKQSKMKNQNSFNVILISSLNTLQKFLNIQ